VKGGEGKGGEERDGKERGERNGKGKEEVGG